jgi:hypothetical protein
VRSLVVVELLLDSHVHVHRQRVHLLARRRRHQLHLQQQEALSTGVTRFGDFSPLGRLFTLGSILKLQKFWRFSIFQNLLIF